jgi:hypothetical protein
MSLTELFCDIDERKPVHTLAKRLSGELFLIMQGFFCKFDLLSLGRDRGTIRI